MKLTNVLLLIGAIGYVDLASGDEPHQKTIRIATYNVSLYRDQSGMLARELDGGNCEQAKQLARVIQTVRPDVLLLNEIDFEPNNAALKLFARRYLAEDQSDSSAIDYPFSYTAPSNTGEPSGMDLDRDGQPGTPGDAWGFGRYPGQYGMAVLSRFPIDESAVRTFRNLRWATMPGARRPIDPSTGKAFYTDAEWSRLRLSSKSHWDVPIRVPGLGTLHLLASHPTPPVFDGPEDRNGCRNHDEIRLWADYVAARPVDYLIDDAGERGGIESNAAFVIAGDLNCDPVDGDTTPAGISQLLNHPQITGGLLPMSKGGIEAAHRHADLNQRQRSDAATDTANFSGDGHGNLRVDYVLPSRDLNVAGTGVFWPASDEPLADAISATDHRLVWIDVALPAASPESDAP